jgi:hypothetical protein
MWVAETKMRLVTALQIKQGTTMAELRNRTGLSDSELAAIVPSGTIERGVVKKAFTIPEGYTKQHTNGAGDVARAMQNAKDAPAQSESGSILGVRTDPITAPPSKTEIAKELLREAKGLENGWVKLGLDAAAVFKRSPGTRADMEEARRLFEGIADARRQMETLVERADVLAAELRPGNAAKKELRELSRRLPHVVRGSIERMMNALPSLFDRMPTVDRYWDTFRELGERSTDMKASAGDRGAAWQELYGLYEDLRARTISVAEAEAKYKDEVQAMLDRLTGASQAIHKALNGAAKGAFVAGKKSDPEAGLALWGACKQALAEAPALAAEAQPVLQKLSFAGPGGEDLHRKLRDEVLRTTQGSVAYGMAEVLNALPTMFGVWPERYLKDSERRELTKQASDLAATPESRQEALATLQGYVDELDRGAKAIASAEKRFAPKVERAVQELREASRRWSSSIEGPIAEWGSLAKRGVDGEAAARSLENAKTVLSEAAELEKKYAPLLKELESTPGATKLRLDLDQALGSTYHGPTNVLSRTIDLWPNMFDLTFYDYLSEGARNDLARKASDLSASPESRREAMETIESRFAALKGAREDIDRAEGTFRRDVDAYSTRVSQAIERWRADLPADKAAVAGGAPNFELAAKLWDACRAAHEESLALKGEADALKRKLEDFGSGTTKLGIDVDNASASAIDAPAHMLQKTFDVLSSVLDTHPWVFLGEWDRGGLSRDAVDLKKPASDRDAAWAQLRASYDSHVAFAKGALVVEKRFKDRLDDVATRISQNTKRWSEVEAHPTVSAFSAALDKTLRLKDDRAKLLEDLDAAGREGFRLRRRIDHDPMRDASATLWRLVSSTSSKLDPSLRDEIRKLGEAIG